MKTNSKNVAIGDLFGRLFKIATHNLGDSDRTEDINLEKDLIVYDTNSTEIKSMVKVEILGTTMIEINGNPEMRFTLNEDFSEIPQTKESASSTFIGDELIAIQACSHLNKANKKKVEDLIEFLSEAVNSYDSVQKRHDDIIKRLQKKD